MSYPSIAANFGPWSDCFQNATSRESSDGISNFGRLGSWLREEKALRGGSCEDSRLNRRGLISLFTTLVADPCNGSLAAAIVDQVARI
jgi:hypothetical protein